VCSDIVVDEVPAGSAQSTAKAVNNVKIHKRQESRGVLKEKKLLQSGKIHDFYVITSQTPGEKLDFMYKFISFPF